MREISEDYILGIVLAICVVAVIMLGVYKGVELSKYETNKIVEIVKNGEDPLEARMAIRGY